MTRRAYLALLVASACGLVALLNSAASAQEPASAPTTVTFLDAGPAAVGDDIELSARVSTSSGAPVDGAVEFYIDGKRFRRTRTDPATGVASVTVGGGLAAGGHTINAIFVGAPDHGLQESSITTTLKVAPLALQVETVPALSGANFELIPENVPGAPQGFSGYTFESNASGVARVGVDYAGTYQLIAQERVLDATDADSQAGVRARFMRWQDDHFQSARSLDVGRVDRVQAGYEVEYLVSQTFVDSSGRPIPEERVDEFTLHSSANDLKVFGREDLLCADPKDREIDCARWLIGSRVRRVRTGLVETYLKYSVDSLIVDGANVVNRAQQQFSPAIPDERQWTIELQLHSAHFTARDAFFRFPVGSGVHLTYPDGHTERHEFESAGELTLEGLARGEYEVTVDAHGRSFKRPLVLSKDQEVDLLVVTYLDMAVVALIGASILVGLILLGRPRLRRELVYRLGRVSAPSFSLRRRTNETRSSTTPASPSASVDPLRRFFLTLGGIGALAIAAAVLACSLPVEAQEQADRVTAEPPTYAYYYIWFDPGSWNRAKIDYPLLGRYSSDDPEIMQTHIRWAKEAGIDGFIVSWKHTDTLSQRLEKLVEVAEREDFDLAVMYQGLDFYRNPLPVSRVEADLDVFVRRFAEHTPFHGLGEPVVILSGSWMFSSSEIARLADRLPDDIQFLASERNLEGYERVAELVDGNAYYWSSVNPETFQGYQEKLNSMSAAADAHDGLWIAPAAPGFDARLVGGTTVVDRKDGETLRQQMEAALRSAPDVVGLISWNEFSENSHVEPSVHYDMQSLDVIGQVLGDEAPVITDVDSSSPGSSSADVNYSLPLVIGAVALFVGGMGVLVWRRSRQRETTGVERGS